MTEQETIAEVDTDWTRCPAHKTLWRYVEVKAFPGKTFQECAECEKERQERLRATFLPFLK